MIGPTDAKERTPKPSMTPGTFIPMPKPIARTSGTVMGPVVTPALSQPKFTKSSLETKVRKRRAMYGGINKYQRSKLKAILATPVPMPQATPMATACISRLFLKAPTVIFSTVAPRALRAGSAKVAPYPSIKAKMIAMNFPLSPAIRGF